MMLLSVFIIAMVTGNVVLAVLYHDTTEKLAKVQRERDAYRHTLEMITFYRGQGRAEQ